MTAKSVATAFIFAGALVSCKKNPVNNLPVPQPPAVMDYIDLGNKEIRQQAPAFFIDLNKDGKIDLHFGTMLVGDAINKQDKLLFLAGSDIETKLPVNTSEQAPALNQAATIPINDFDGYTWFEASSVELVRKVTGMDAPVFWEGNWKAATRKYLPVQVIKNNQRFNGWVELTVDIVNEKIVLHRAAISKLGEKAIQVG